MKIAVGSTNPVKVTAVQQIMAAAFPEATVISVDVPSGVSNMPMSDAECIAGAKNRAVAAQQQRDADLGVGLEGGVQATPEGLMLVGWVAIVDRNGRFGIGGAGRLPLPDPIAMRVLTGEELGPVLDELLDTHNIKQKGGAVGALTGELMLRSDAFALSVAYALGPFVTDLYQENL